MNKKLILIGGGGHCKSVIDVAESLAYNIIGVIDIAKNVGESILGYPFLGTDDVISNYVDDCEFIVAVGQIKKSDLRRKLQGLVIRKGGKLATIISKNAYVSKHSTIGQGTIIMHQAIVNAGVKIGEGCIINTLANIEHDVEVGNFCHISTGAMVNGGCKICNDVFIGSQAVVSNEISICKNTIIGAGTLVIRSIVEQGTYIGNPAKKIVL